MTKKRLDHEPPEAIQKWGWKYHHLGIPTSLRMPNEVYIPAFKVYTSGFSTCPFGIEWMRYEHDSPVDKLIQTVPHLAFEVDDIDHELSVHKFNIITEANSPSDGVRVVMIEHNRAPLELIEFAGKKNGV